MSIEEYIKKLRLFNNIDLWAKYDRLNYVKEGSIDANERDALRILLFRRNTYDMMNFVFHRKVDIVEIQKFAMLVKQALRGSYAQNNVDFLLLEMPEQIADLDSLYDFTKSHKHDYMFYISTLDYDKIEYYTQPNIQIPTIEIPLYLRILQNKFMLLMNNPPSVDSKMIFDFTQLFIYVNNGIQDFFYFKAEESGNFDWNAKYSPCFIDLETLRYLNGIFDKNTLEFNKTRNSACLKYLILKFAYQCRFLSFWSCLIIIATFPSLNAETKEVLNNFISYLLNNFANIYLYDIVVEGATIKSVPIVDRKSDANTTRLKIYFTHDNGKPSLIRLDLPHIEHPYVHINLEGESGDNEHIRLSKDTDSFAYDSVFDKLCDALLNLDYLSSVCHHSPASDDPVTFKEMKIRSALFDYAPVVYEEKLLGKNSKLSQKECSKSTKNLLLSYLSETEIFRDDELHNLSSEEILMCVDSSLNRTTL